jgi:hypothetical protein
MRSFGAVLFLSSAVLLGTVALVSRADAGACKDAAKATFLDCKAQCKSDFLDQKFTCRNVQPACGRACLAGRQACFDRVEEILDTGVVSGHCSQTMNDPCRADADCPNGEQCVVDSSLTNCPTGTNACNAAFTATATGAPPGGCGATCGPQGQVCSCHGDTTCQDCIDGAQVTRFLCRDGCRDSFRVNTIVISEKQNCRAGFKACVQACPPAS